MASVMCPKCGSRNTIVKKNCDFKESDFNVSDNREGKLSNSSGLNKEGTVVLGELIKLAGKLIDAWVNNNKKKIYCRDCGYYGDI